MAYRRIALLSLCLSWGLLCFWGFNKFAYEIDQFNAKTRTFLRTGKFDIRYFDGNGMPVSTDVRTGRQFISPFYVVHYGLMHSEAVRTADFDFVEHWRDDPSVALWNEPPEKLSAHQFKVNADWVVDNLSLLNGKMHLVYNFDWAYKNYPTGTLKAPWWSGLTDGYALLLMLRAHDVYKEEKYLKVADALYESVLTPLVAGGSLVELNGMPWIEEYVDPRVKANDMSRVLNGMIYAYKGVKAYEDKRGSRYRLTAALRNSIISNIKEFDTGYWSMYDVIGTSSNIKYHRIHIALLEDPDLRDALVDEIRSKWRYGAENSGVFWILSDGLNVAKIHFLAGLFLVVGFGWLFLKNVFSWSRVSLSNLVEMDRL